MLKRVLAIMLTGMLLTMALGFGPVKAQSPHDEARDAVPDDPGTAAVRMDVLKMGVGEKARVEVRLRDNGNLRGYIGEATESSFTVVSSKDWSNHRVAYPEVEKVKKAGNGFSSRSWIILGAAIAGAVATWIIVKPALCDGGAQTRGPC